MEKTLPSIPAKRYFTIGEVSELCSVKPYVLRYWEQEFTQLKPMKRRGNRRYYQHHEVLLIRRIRELLYDHGFTISGARNRLSDGMPARYLPEDPTLLSSQPGTDHVSTRTQPVVDQPDSWPAGLSIPERVLAASASAAVTRPVGSAFNAAGCAAEADPVSASADLIATYSLDEASSPWALDYFRSELTSIRDLLAA